MASKAAEREAVERRRALVVRCAWCDRVRVGDRWIEDRRADETRDFTHTICADCDSDLRRRGASR